MAETKVSPAEGGASTQDTKWLMMCSRYTLDKGASEGLEDGAGEIIPTCCDSKGGWTDLYALHCGCCTIGCWKPCIACSISRDSGKKAGTGTSFWWAVPTIPCLCCVHGWVTWTRKDTNTVSLKSIRGGLCGNVCKQERKFNSGAKNTTDGDWKGTAVMKR